MLLASCTPDVVVCDDTPEPPVDLLLVSLQAGALLVAVVVLLTALWWCCRVRVPRPRRRVLISSGGDLLGFEEPVSRG